MIDAIVPPADRAALWAALPTLPISWDAIPSSVTLGEDTHLRYSNAPDGEMSYLVVTLYETEYVEDLTYGLGDYTEEELADPYAVIGGYHQQAHDLAQDMVKEATLVLGEPVERTPDARASWLLPDRTISVGVTQADKECPIEVCVWLLPPGITASALSL